MAHNPNETIFRLMELDAALREANRRAFGETFGKAPFRADPIRHVPTNPATYANSPDLKLSDLGGVDE